MHPPDVMPIISTKKLPWLLYHVFGHVPMLLLGNSPLVFFDYSYAALENPNHSGESVRLKLSG